MGSPETGAHPSNPNLKKGPTMIFSALRQTAPRLAARLRLA